MSTNPIPAGTCNFPVNLPKPLRAALGRFSTLQGARSLGAWIRGILSLEVTGWRLSLRRGAAEICALNGAGERLFASIAADGVVTADEAATYREFLRREREADEQHSAIAHLEPVDVPASVIEEARAAMERIASGNLSLGSMIAAAKGAAS